MIITPNNPFVTFPNLTAFGFVDDDFENSVLDGRWKEIQFKTPAPTKSLATEGSQQSLKIAAPDNTKYDINQSATIEGLFVYQDVTANEDWELIAEVVYPDETFSSTNSMYLGIGILFYYDINNYTWIEAQCHPTTGARMRWGIDDATSGASASTNAAPPITIPVTPIYLKIKKTGSTFEYFVSNDDSTYYSLGTKTGANLATNGNKIGIIMATYISPEVDAVAYDFYCRSIKEIYST